MKKTKSILEKGIAVIILITLTSISGYSAPKENLYWGNMNNAQKWERDSKRKADVTTAGFYIQVNGEIMDTKEDISSRDVIDFTGIIAKTNIIQKLDYNFKKAWTIEQGNSELQNYVAELPDIDNALKVVVDKYSGTDAFIRSSNGKIVPWINMNSKYYYIHWYVLKCEDDLFHIDGVIVDCATNKEVQIVIPDKNAKRATCVEYNVKIGTFTPGIMEIKANRPHSYWDGSNDSEIIEGFNEVWYTVLNEDTFEPIDAIIPSTLINTATVVAKLATARLTELDSNLQKEYGRIDSQAYKQEYIKRTGSGGTLYVTPFIAEMLKNKYNVYKDNYIWLAMGDSYGNIEKVYVMDRNMAEINNIFDNE